MTTAISILAFLSLLNIVLVGAVLYRLHKLEQVIGTWVGELADLIREETQYYGKRTEVQSVYPGE